MKNRNALFLLSLLSLLSGSAALAQSGPYGNEWIDYSRSYFKFRIGTNNVYRISRASLDAMGLPPTVTGSQFRMFRDGQQVPIMVSAETMTAGDYIEFIGTREDGLLDRELYKQPLSQANDRISLYGDTATYFLTWTSTGAGLRYGQTANSIPSAPPAPLGWYWTVAGNYYKANSAYSKGPTQAPPHPFYSSQYEPGEGFVNGLTAVPNPLSIGLATPNVVTGAGVNATAITRVLSRSDDNNHQMQVNANGSFIGIQNWGPADTREFTGSLAASGLSSTTTFYYQPQNPGPNSNDFYGASFVELKYPRDFAINGSGYFAGSLPASSSPQYLEFTGAGAGGGRLYDLTNGRWYEGDGSVPGKLRFYLQPSADERRFVLSGTVVPATPLSLFAFTDYSAADYVIISQKAIMGAGSKVQNYAAYRRSSDGGSFTVQAVDVTELYDQFAYGVEGHPLSIRHFLQYAYDSWSLKPQYVLLIGRGIGYEQRAVYEANRSYYNFPLVPTYGTPGSDVDLVNFSGADSQKIMIGRLPVWNDGEVGDYLEKIKVQEAALKPVALPTYASEWWKKQALHIVGGTSAGEQGGLKYTMDRGKAILEDTSTGKVVTTILKYQSGPIQTEDNQTVFNMLNNGVSQVTFHGHASSSGFEYNINSPEIYHNSPRMGLLLGLGCDVANMFYVDPGLSTRKTVAEKYALSPHGGSIVTVAANTEGFTNFHQSYLAAFYSSEASANYGGTIGQHYRFAYDSMMTAWQNNLFGFTHLESMQLIGDPAARMPGTMKPDYYLDASLLSTQPVTVTTSMDSFRLRITALNLGRAVEVPVKVRVERTSPSGATTTAASYYIRHLKNSDTSYVTLPINKLTDIGVNRLTVKVEAADSVDEASEANNVARLDVFIYSDNLVPVYPREFAIVNRQGVTLKASTLNAFRPAGRYVMQIDTTELFNSPLLQETYMNSFGGVLKWKPNVIYKDSVVYYWRGAYNTGNGGDTVWSGSSFIYLANGSEGWNQSHYYQYKKDQYSRVSLDADRHFRFKTATNLLTVKNTVAYVDDDGEDGKIYYNGAYIQAFSQFYSPSGSVIIMVIDSCTGQPFLNTPGNTQGARPPQDQYRGTRAREFPFYSEASRMAAARYLDSIPEGHYVIIKNTAYVKYLPTNISWVASLLRADSAANNGHSLYHSIKALGFNLIDSFNSDRRAFIFVRRKGRTDFPVYQNITGTTRGEILTADFNLTACGGSGEAASTVIGPAMDWSSLHWKNSPLDAYPSSDSPRVSIVGIDTNGRETPLYVGRVRDTSLSFIQATIYPNLRLNWLSYDSTHWSSPQLDYWRVLYMPVPEAALNAAAKFTFTDSVSVGQPVQFRAAIENLTPLGMDSMLVRYKLIDAKGVTHTLASHRYRPLPGNDTLEAGITFDPAPYPGNNVFFVEANPDHDQTEQYHPNNLGYLPFKVSTDKTNPLLDVTFDGVHILDGDIVSAKPLIRIKLKDENQFLALNDTAVLKLRLLAPGNSQDSARIVPFDGTTCRFIPASDAAGGHNEAVIEYRPAQLDDGTYTLFVTGKDRTGNKAGGASTDYQISFEVYNKPAITQVLNYPNPFSTSTAFVFTLTGSEIPQQFKIQILSVTGKVVREITRGELGPLHIGRNITEYKWDGRDQFGQLLGNGVYLYRVVTTLNGRDMDRFNGIEDGNGRAIDSKTDGGGAAVDKFFKGGYGKMYIMR